MTDDMSDTFVTWLVIWSGGFEEPVIEAWPGGGSFKDALRRGREYLNDSGRDNGDRVDVIGIEFTGEIGWHEQVIMIGKTIFGANEFNVDRIIGD